MVVPLNECSGCGQDFASLSAFEKHRVGKFLQKGSGEWDPFSNGDWTPEKGRRCLSSEELRELGLHQDSRGRWRWPAGERTWNV